MASSNIFPNLKIHIVEGDSADTNIPVTNIELPLTNPDGVTPVPGAENVQDRLLAVLGLDLNVSGSDTLVNAFNDRTATSSITSDGNIQCTADTSAEILWVFWLDASDVVTSP